MRLQLIACDEGWSAAHSGVGNDIWRRDDIEIQAHYDKAKLEQICWTETGAPLAGRIRTHHVKTCPQIKEVLQGWFRAPFAVRVSGGHYIGDRVAFTEKHGNLAREGRITAIAPQGTLLITGQADPSTTTRRNWSSMQSPQHVHAVDTGSAKRHLS